MSVSPAKRSSRLTANVSILASTVASRAKKPIVGSSPNCAAVKPSLRSHNQSTLSPSANLVLDYIKRHVDVHYRKNGEPTSEARHIRDAVRPMCALFGSEPAAEFGPLKLELVRNQYVAAEMVRRSVNRHASRIKRLFKWAVAKQIVNPAVYQALACVDGLRAGRSAAKESKPVRPVSEEIVAKTLPYLPEPVAAMVRMQWLTGARPGEICILRPCDISKGEDGVWTYILESHRCEHHGTERKIFFGPEAQKVLAPWLNRNQPSVSNDAIASKTNATHVPKENAQGKVLRDELWPLDSRRSLEGDDCGTGCRRDFKGRSKGEGKGRRTDDCMGSKSIVLPRQPTLPKVRVGCGPGADTRPAASRCSSTSRPPGYRRHARRSATSTLRCVAL